MGLLPEIKEKDANGKILLIYNDIKEITGFPLVNLIFRSMATINGCLETSWFTLRPLYLNQSIQQSASYYFTKNKFEFNDSLSIFDWTGPRISLCFKWSHGSSTTADDWVICHCYCIG